jgi:hypothetical protein
MVIPAGCGDCDYKAACHEEHKLRLCMGGDLHSKIAVGSARSLAVTGKFTRGVDYDNRQEEA